MCMYVIFILAKINLIRRLASPTHSNLLESNFKTLLKEAKQTLSKWKDTDRKTHLHKDMF